jgi:hypothetical protein
VHEPSVVPGCMSCPAAIAKGATSNYCSILDSGTVRRRERKRGCKCLCVVVVVVVVDVGGDYLE